MYVKGKNGEMTKTMYKGAWVCIDCSKPIYELPFKPQSESNLRCKQCYKRLKAK